MQLLNLYLMCFQIGSHWLEENVCWAVRLQSCRERVRISRRACSAVAGRELEVLRVFLIEAEVREWILDLGLLYRLCHRILLFLQGRKVLPQSIELDLQIFNFLVDLLRDLALHFAQYDILVEFRVKLVSLHLVLEDPGEDTLESGRAVTVEDRRAKLLKCIVPEEFFDVCIQLTDHLGLYP